MAPHGVGRRQAAIAALTAIAALAAISSPAPAADGFAHAPDGGAIPAWVKTVFVFYADGQITEAELIAALQYLVEHGIIRVSEPAAAAADAPTMSAEAISYRLQAEAVERASIESRMAILELMSIVPAAAAHMEPDEYEALQGQAAGVKALAADMDMAVAAHIAAMRSAAADGAIDAAEQDAIEAADAAAARATDMSTEATMAIMPALQRALIAASMGAFLGPEP